MQRTEVQAAILRVMREKLRMPDTALSGFRGDTPLLGQGLGLDSVEVMTLLTGLEQALRISVPDEALDPAHFRTLDAFTDFLLSQLTSRGA